MTSDEALIWADTIMRTFDRTLAPWHASTNYEEQIRTYHCFGCSGEFQSRFPNWAEPTLETFPHGPDCHYVAYVKAVERAVQPTKEDQ